MLDLNELGNRICIIGCPSSGKSTLGGLLSKKLRIPVAHLDLLAHDKNTNWQRKPDVDFIALHHQLLEQESWIIEGNYSICMKERFLAATAIIWLDLNVCVSAIRYIERCLFGSKTRVGKLPGSQKEFSFWLLKHILCVYPKNRVKYQQLLASTPCVKIDTVSKLKKTRLLWGL